MSDKKSLVAKLCEVMAAVEKIPKRGMNEHYGYTYATEADVVEHVRKELSKRSIFLLPTLKEITERETITRKGNKETVTTVTVQFTFFDAETGESLAFTMPGSGQDAGDKGIYKALTGATKYALMKAFLIPTEDDPEREPAPADEPKSEHQAVPQAGEGGVTQKQLALIWKLAQQIGYSKEELHNLMEERYRVLSSKELTKKEASDFIEYLIKLRDGLGVQKSDEAQEEDTGVPF